MAIFRTSKRPAPWGAAHYFCRSQRLHLSFRPRFRSRKERTVAYDAQKNLADFGLLPTRTAPRFFEGSAGSVGSAGRNPEFFL